MGPWKNVDAVIKALNEPARPKAPEISKHRIRNPRNGLQLRAIHKHHLTDIARARSLLNQMEAGGKADLAGHVAGMEITQNFQTFGNLCGRECMVLDAHHNIEEAHMFPNLEATGVKGVQTVVAKLRKEHKIVHRLIELLYDAAVDLVQDPNEAHFKAARALFDQLEAVVRSHFGYEETELEEALGTLDAI